MAPPTRTARTTWIDEGLALLAAGGPDAVRIEPLAQSLGVTRGGFYHHFADRGAFLEAVLDRWEQLSIDAVIAHVEGHGGDARTRLRSLFGLASSRRGAVVLKADLAVRDWSRRDPAVARRLRRVDNRRMAYMRTLFADFATDADDVEARCMVAMSLFVGHHFVAADHEGRTRARVLDLVLARLLVV